jgi:hypothetical protein
VFKYAFFRKAEVFVITSEANACLSCAIGDYIIMHMNSFYPEQFIIIGAMLCCDFQTNVTIKNEIVIYFYVLAAIDIDAAGTWIIFPILQIGFVPLRADIVNDIARANAVPDHIGFIWIIAAVFIRMFRCPFKADHIDSDVIVVMNDIVLDGKAVNIAVQDHRLAGTAFAIVNLTSLDGDVFNRYEIITGVYTDAVGAPHAMDRTVFDADIC